LFHSFRRDAPGAAAFAGRTAHTNNICTRVAHEWQIGCRQLSGKSNEQTCMVRLANPLSERGWRHEPTQARSCLICSVEKQSLGAGAACHFYQRVP
jgi:hypothetical protein